LHTDVQLWIDIFDVDVHFKDLVCELKQPGTESC
jgi:hypothetical protein